MWFQQNKIITPIDYSIYLHHNGKGVVVFAKKTQEKWEETVVPINDIENIVVDYAGQYNIYLTQNRFWLRRRIAHLAELNALFVDLDYYKAPKLAARDPTQILEMVFIICEEEGIPAPTLSFFTGRGVALIWKHSPLPRQAIPRWQACQRELHQAFVPLASDQGCRDAARVLRLIGTRNSKSKKKVKALYINQYDEWDFNDLADEILPYTREELAEIRDIRIARAKKEAKKKEEKPALLQKFNMNTLWEARLTDLQRLAFMRHGSQLPPGNRDLWLFVASVAISWITYPETLEREIIALAAQVANWSEEEAMTNMGSVIRRGQAAAQGEKITWNGKEFDPRYRFRTSIIIKWLEVTMDEQLELQVLISPELARERKIRNEEQRRRNQGAVSRYEYLFEVEERRRLARELRLKGWSISDIAKKMGVHRNTVTSYLR